MTPANETGNKWFKAELWHNGENIFSGINTGNSTEGKEVKVKNWEVLRNVYSSSKQDESNLEVASESSSWTFSFVPGAAYSASSYNANDYEEWRPANILKVTLEYDNYTYYATLPVIVVRNWLSSSYRTNLKENTGFRKVLYSS